METQRRYSDALQDLADLCSWDNCKTIEDIEACLEDREWQLDDDIKEIAIRYQMESNDAKDIAEAVDLIYKDILEELSTRNAII